MTELTPHLQRVLKLADGSIPVSAIARTLGIAQTSVQTYLTSLRAKGYEPKTLTLVDVLERGATSLEEAADLVGIPMRTARTIAHRAGMDHLYIHAKRRTPPPEMTLREKILTNRIPAGARSLSDALLELPDDILEWLVKEMPARTTLAEMVRAIITDAALDA